MQKKDNKISTAKNKKRKKSKYSKGITLVALVITIIVLIILAGISINLVLGEDGIFKRAVEAREKTKEAQKNEQEILSDLGYEIESVGELAKVVNLKTKNEYFTKKTMVEDSNGNKIVVPAGFKIAADSGNNVTEGIVIEDEDVKADGNNQQRGNQYVWIPVSNIDAKGSNKIKKSNGEGIEITLGRYEFADGTTVYKDNEGKNLNNGKALAKGTEILRQKAEEYATPKTVATYYQELKDYREGIEKQDKTGLNRTAKELEKFIDSVKQNGGYYIARYEASYGADNKPNSKVSNGFNNNTTVPSMEGYLWNNINQIKAAETCDGIYTTVQSDLVNSYAWDTAILYIQKFSGDTDYSRQDGHSINSKLTNTGKNSDEVCKIHDMASNCSEWATEYSTYVNSSNASPCVIRGGYYNSSTNFTSFRGYYDATHSDENRTFRCILYIK